MFEPLIIRSFSASDLCFQALYHFVTDGPEWERTEPRGLPVRESCAMTYHLENALDCVAWLHRRKLNYGFMAAEFSWIYLGREDVESIARFCPNIHHFSDDGVTFFGAYGPRFRSQLHHVVSALLGDTDTRQAVLTIWRPNPARTRDVPCTVAAQFLQRGSKLHGIFTMRSSDAWLGLPYDVFNFSRLTAVVAGRVGLPVGSLTINVGSAHLYERNLERANEVVDAAFVGLESMSLPLPQADVNSDEVLNQLLDGVLCPWPEGYGPGGWYDLYATLRWALTKEERWLTGALGEAIVGDSDAS